MNYYKATLQYDGTNFFGFQWQQGMPTIQNELNVALHNLIGGKISTMGASRTDAGVHAYEQIVKISSEHQINSTDFLKEFNKNLPTQIRCLTISPCEGFFRPTVGSASKEYRYLFSNFISQDPCAQSFLINNPYPLDLNVMKRCVDKIQGKVSFHNFCSTGSNVKTIEREILSCELSEINPHDLFRDSDLFQFPQDLTSCYQFRVEASGFIKHMVRHLMGALWMVGRGKISEDEFFTLLHGPQKTKRLWKAASPRGLYLYKFNSEIV
jgi:tRNA pseudouridine38-40 synthase